MPTPRNLEPIPPPARLKGPAMRGKVLVLAPHPDDETIGPGATLSMHAAGGDDIHVVFVSAGTAGDPTGALDPEEYAATRQAEARAAADVLGIAHLEFWGLPDGTKVNENDVAMLLPRVIDAIERVKPDVLYAPHEADQHSDHHAVCVIARRALAAVKKPPHAFGYEVWTASTAAFVVDVSAAYERKMEALACYASQLEHTDIVRFVSGLNAYRAVFLGKGAKFGEAFVPLTKDARAGAG
jgi:LmbE family N-acetylglucosaminyl deacetylase